SPTRSTPWASVPGRVRTSWPPTRPVWPPSSTPGPYGRAGRGGGVYCGASTRGRCGAAAESALRAHLRGAGHVVDRVDRADHEAVPALSVHAVVRDRGLPLRNLLGQQRFAGRVGAADQE